MTDTTPLVPLVLNNLNSAAAIVDGSGRPLPSLTQTINNAWRNILVSFNALAANEGDIAAIVAQQADILAQIVAINGLIVDVNGKLTSAAITNSYTDPTSVLTATVTGANANIIVADHTRVYTDGVTVAVTGSTITGLAADTTYYVFYSDPTRAGGTVTYQTSTDEVAAAQVGGIHSCGSIYTDSTSTGPITGGGTTPPGSGGKTGPKVAIA